VKAALSDLKPLLRTLPRNPINQPILDRNSAGPPSFEVAFERLGLSRTREWVALTFLD
jgi:hypothetical protein